MLSPYLPDKIELIGREGPLKKLQAIAGKIGPSIVVLYGRRRVGKTELIEQAFRKRALIKIEGLEGQAKERQIEHTLYQLAQYLKDPYIAQLKFTTWVEVFELMADRLPNTELTLYLEELQWLANYDAELVSALKYIWDNRLRHNKKWLIILCGSSPSFMITCVLHSRALYNRSTNELHLKPFSLYETKLFLKKRSHREIMTAYLTLGGIPEYLKQIQSAPSILLGLCQGSFTSDGYFTREYDRIFISSMAENVYYKKIVDFLSKQKFASRKEIAKHLKIQSGGTLTEILSDLSLCGFIQKYNPYQAEGSSLLTRYCVSDSYLMFYYKFIKPKISNIEKGFYEKTPMEALQMSVFEKWMGFSFERFIRDNANIIAKILGFSSVQYKCGAYFNRNTNKIDPGYQIDLVFERDDHVYTICEVKYYSKPVDTNVIKEFENKVELFDGKKRYTIQRVLITTEGATQALTNRHYFDRIITLDELFDKSLW